MHTETETRTDANVGTQTQTHRHTQTKPYDGELLEARTFENRETTGWWNHTREQAPLVTQLCTSGDPVSWRVFRKGAASCCASTRAFSAKEALCRDRTRRTASDFSNRSRSSGRSGNRDRWRISAVQQGSPVKEALHPQSQDSMHASTGRTHRHTDTTTAATTTTKAQIDVLGGKTTETASPTNTDTDSDMWAHLHKKERWWWWWCVIHSSPLSLAMASASPSADRARATHDDSTGDDSASPDARACVYECTYTYIYIYVCVCVCVCHHRLWLWGERCLPLTLPIQTRIQGDTAAGTH